MLDLHRSSNGSGVAMDAARAHARGEALAKRGGPLPLGGLMQASTRILVLAGALTPLLLGGCSYNSPTDPGAPSGPEGAVVTITSSGLDPRTVTIAAGQSVTFVNSDSIAHDIASDPYPRYTDCPGINRVGNLGSGQRTQTAALTVVRSCGYHDLLRNTDVRWHGTIEIR